MDVPYQHLIFTIPEELRPWLKVNRKKGLDALFLAVKNTLINWTKQKGYRPGLISVLHTFGADLKWNPHIHVIITCGGLSNDETRWIENKYLPWQALRPMFRYAFLQELKKLFKNNELKTPPGLKHLKTCNNFNAYLSPLYKKEWFISLGKSLEDAEPSIRYIGRYCKRPVMAESNITAFDGKNVSFQFKDRATKKITTLTLGVQEFIGRLVQHIPDQHFRILRHAGIFANCVRKKKLKKSRILLKQNEKTIPPRLTWREMFMNTFQKDPLTCSICHGIMKLKKIEFVNSQNIINRVMKKQRQLSEDISHVTKKTCEKKKTTKKQNYTNTINSSTDPPKKIMSPTFVTGVNKLKTSLFPSL